MTTLRKTLSEIPEPARYDLIVIGAGTAGLASAVAGGLAGARVLVLEAADHVGGTSAYSAGTIWVPNTHLARGIGADDSLEKAMSFLDAAVGNRSPQDLRRAYLEAGPDVISILESRAGMRFRARPLHPDYLSDLPGATSYGRAIEPMPFDGRRLGEDFSLIRPPIPEFTIFGGLMVDRDDIASLLTVTRSRKSFIHALRLLGRYGADRLRYRRGTRLVMGNALIGALLLAARQAGVEIVVGARVQHLLTEDGTVTGVEVAQAGQTRRIAAGAGVILATGGFAGDPQRRAAALPRAVPPFSPSVLTPKGGLIGQVEALGGRLGTGAWQDFFWAPCSVNKRRDGSLAVFPHFVFDRSKPGTICIDSRGRRFVNESVSYHQFGAAMICGNSEGTTIPCFIVADAKAIQKYGLGLVRPGARGLDALIASGYVTTAPSMSELAQKLSVDPANLEVSVGEMNGFAREGTDKQFGRGSTVYQRVNGDPAHGPNPTLGEIASPPFYAVTLWPCDIGSATGFVTDDFGRIVNPDRMAIEGLYAVGNDMQSVMGGVYPGPGITLGPALVFGYRAGCHAATRDDRAAAQ